MRPSQSGQQRVSLFGEVQRAEFVVASVSQLTSQSAVSDGELRDSAGQQVHLMRQNRSTVCRSQPPVLS